MSLFMGNYLTKENVSTNIGNASSMYRFFLA